MVGAGRLRRCHRHRGWLREVIWWPLLTTRQIPDAQIGNVSHRKNTARVPNKFCPSIDWIMHCGQAPDKKRGFSVILRPLIFALPGHRGQTIHAAIHPRLAAARWVTGHWRTPENGITLPFMPKARFSFSD